MFTSYNGDRANAPNSIIIITDGVPRVPADVYEARRLTLQEADLARGQGINVFAVGIGPELTIDFLSQMADQPPDKHVFQVNQIRELETILNEVSSAACGSIPTLPGKQYLFFQNVELVYQAIFMANRTYNNCKEIYD